MRWAAALIVGLFPTLVLARPALTIDAEVSADLRRVWGLIRVEDGEGIVFADPMALVPEPQDDLVLTRTYPGPPEQGSTRLVDLGPGLYWFETRLPRRLGDLGVEPGEAMWANGGFFPQPLLGGRVEVLEWSASVRLPAGALGGLNGQAGEGRLRFEGVADRLSLAVMYDARLTELAPGLTLLERGVHRPRRDDELRALYATLPRRAPLLIIETEDQRRLARPGPGTLFLAELAFRLSPPLPRLHRAGVLEGMLTATLEVEELWWRQLAARALAQEATARARAEAAAAARLGGWIPVVDALVYSGRAPFHAEVFSEAYPGDPLRDDLAERFNPEEVGGVAAVKLDDRYGLGTASALAARLQAGNSPELACAFIGVPLAELLAWRTPTAHQDLTLSVRPALGEPGWRVEVVRDAPPDAPIEPVVVVIDGERHLWDAPPGGRQSWSWPRAPRGVVVDPEHHVKQTSAAGDAWPPRVVPVLYAAPTSVNLTERLFAGSATLRMRRRYDTRKAIDLGLYADEQVQAALSLGLSAWAGPLQDRRQRPHYLSLSLSPIVFNPAFRPTDDGRVALEMSLGYAWDSRVGWTFPVEGARLSVAVDGGLVPNSDARWASARAGALGLWSPHPRVVLAGRASVGQAWGQVDHRLLALGGSGATRGVAPGAAVGTSRALAGLDLRVMPLRDLSWPLAWVYWLEDVQLTAGIEGGAVGGATLSGAAGQGRYGAFGLSGGLLFTVDGLGLIPGQLGLTVARPLWASHGIPKDPQLLVRWGQEF